MDWVYGVLGVLFILYLFGDSGENKENKPVVPERPIKKGIDIEVLAKEYSDNPLRFMQQWKDKTLVVKGTIEGFGENPVYEDHSGTLMEIKGKYILLGCDSSSLYLYKMYFHFPADSTELYEFNVGDKVEIEGTLIGCGIDNRDLVFIHCTIFR